MEEVEDEHEELDCVTVDQVLVHLLVLLVRFLGDHGECCREKVYIESLRVRAKTLVDALRELLEFLHVLREETVLLTLNIVGLDGSLQQLYEKLKGLIFDRFNFTHRDDRVGNGAILWVASNEGQNCTFLRS